MNIEQRTSNNKVRMDCSVPRIFSSETIELPEEQFRVDPVPLDDEPFVTIECYKDQQDPLTVLCFDDSAERPNLDSSAITKDDASTLLSKSVGSIKMYHPFASHVEEFPPSFFPNLELNHHCSPPNASSNEKPIEFNEDTNRGEVFVISDDESPLQQHYARFKPSKVTKKLETKGSLEPKKGSAIIADEKSEVDGVRPIVQSINAKVPGLGGESEAVLNAQKVYMNGDDDDDYVICTEDETPDVLLQELFQQMLQNMAERRRASSELRQKKKAEIDLAKQVVRLIMQPSSELTQNSHRAVPSRVESRVDLMSPKQQREAAWAESAWARRLIQLLSWGYSFQHAIQELKSAAPYSIPACLSKRQKNTNVCGGPGADRVTKAHKSKAKQVRQRNSRVDARDHLVKTQAPVLSRPTASPVQPSLPSYSREFNKPDCRDRATLCESLVHEPIHGEPSPPVSEQALQLSHPPSLDEYQPERAKKCSSLLSAVHPFHLLPPTSITELEGRDFLSPEVSDIVEQTFPNENLPTDTSSSISRILSFENF